MTNITLPSPLWLAEVYRTDHPEFTTAKILGLAGRSIGSNDPQELAKQLWDWISITQRNDLFELFNENTRNRIDAWTGWCEEPLDEDCPLNPYRYVNYYDLCLVDNSEMGKNSGKVATIVKININRSRPEWVSEDGDGGPNKEDLGDYKFWNPSVAQESAIDRIIASENAKEENFTNNELQHTIPRWVRASDAGVGILLSTGLPMKLLHEWWPLDFNTNAGPIRAPQRGNMGRAWIKSGAVVEYKGYIFSGSLGESINLPKIVVGRDGSEVNKSKAPTVSSLSSAPSEDLNTNTPKPTKFKPHLMPPEHSSPTPLSFPNMSDTPKRSTTHLREASDMPDISSEEDCVEPTAEHSEVKKTLETAKEALTAFKALAGLKIGTLVATGERMDKINVMHAGQIADELDYLKRLQKNAPKEIAQSIGERRSVLKNHMAIAIQIRTNTKKDLEHAFPLTEKRVFNHRSDWEVPTGLTEWREGGPTVTEFGDNFGTLTVPPEVAPTPLQEAPAPPKSAWTIESPKPRASNPEDLTTPRRRSIYAPQLNNAKRRSSMEVGSSAPKRREGL